MNIPSDLINCKDVNCDKLAHKEEIDTYVKDILEAVSDSGRETIPMSKTQNETTSKTKKTAGWKDFVEPFQDKAHFWHSVWVSADKPVNTELHRIMKKSRNRFHYQVRKCRRIEDFLKNRKIVENCLENDTDLFSEIKKAKI